MKPGSVIVDMAAANGGNCELSVADQMVVTDNGVRVIGYTDLAGRLPTQASQLFATNLVNLLKLLTPGKDGQPVLDMDDQVVRGYDGGPGRRAAVAAAPGPGVGRRPREGRRGPDAGGEEGSQPATAQRLLLVVAVLLLGLLGAFSP